MSGEGQSSGAGILQAGELVILTDGQRAVIAEARPEATELHYIIELPDGTRQQVEAGNLIRAKTYASWVAPGTGWDGRERRKGTGPLGQLLEPNPDWRGSERRQP